MIDSEMYYSPHILQKCVTAEQTTDEYGRYINTETSEEWTYVCDCRCDQNGEKLLTLPDGRVVRPDFHVVLDERSPELQAGDHVRCLWKSDGSLKAEGKIINFKPLNLLPYAEIYL